MSEWHGGKWSSPLLLTASQALVDCLQYSLWNVFVKILSMPLRRFQAPYEKCRPAWRNERQHRGLDRGLWSSLPELES